MIQLLSDFIYVILIISLANSFVEFDVFPLKEIGAARACIRGVGKMAAE